MIVEFCGIPGGGKSTLARTYAERYPESTLFVGLEMKKRSPEVLYGALFFLRHPIVSFWLISFVLRYHMRGLFWYSLHMAIRASAKYQKARGVRPSMLVFLDEGLVHILCTISAYPLSKKDLRKWIERVLLVDVVCVADEGDFHRFHNSHASLHPRVRRGDSELKKWELAVSKNTSNVISNLSENGCLMWRIPSKSSLGFEEKIAMMHMYFKTLT